ncbi:hypothetical protein FRB94_003349 [Tulasnella sp. JGI-2019a]|nr:hypothetical protein FRB93_013347 [Tulasnella sp. JGI-2019a]KAG9003188.1 hypothetical protein FRB94_003349 [Tulasnella sp. JGI-2019a]KAG9030796.1 hypothetical protein FRB95_003555 [Tulasnella sp. JGI-2019a]
MNSSFLRSTGGCLIRQRSTAIQCRAPLEIRRDFFSVSDLHNLLPFNNANEGGDPESNNNAYHERKIMPYSQKQLFDIVSDVGSYNRFLPFCKRSRMVRAPVPRPTQTNKDAYDVQHELTIGFLAFEESYVSTVKCVPFESVEATASSALFKSLTTSWRFQPASRYSPHATSATSDPPRSAPGTDTSLASPGGQGPTLLSIDIDYAFASPTHATVAAKVFGSVSSQIMQAFEKRCLEVYGKGTR